MKTYVLVPLAALLLFIGYHWHAAGVLREADAAREAALVADHAAALKAEHDAQQQALAAMLAVQEQRKKDRAAQDARDLADHAARQAALDTLDAARHRQTDFARQIDRLQQDIAAENKSIAELEASRKAALDEQTFLRDFNAQADANVKALTAVLEKIAARAAAAIKAAPNATGGEPSRTTSGEPGRTTP